MIPPDKALSEVQLKARQSFANPNQGLYFHALQLYLDLLPVFI